MTNTLGIDFDADLNEMSTDIPVVLTWGAQTITGHASEIGQERDTAPEGSLNLADLQWMGAVADFDSSTLPGMRATVSVGGVNYHIDRITRHSDGAGVTFDLRRV